MTLPLAVELLRKTTPEGALAENQPLNLSHKSKLSEELSERQGKQFLSNTFFAHHQFWFRIISRACNQNLISIERKL